MGKILAEIAGRIATLLAFYDDDFYNVLCDAEGHLQVDVLSSPLPTDAATETTLVLVKDRIGATTSPASGSTNNLLTDALTALQLIDDLRGALDSVGSDELDVNVDASVLPTGAATETTLGLVKDRIGALSTPAGGSTNKLLTDALTALQLIDDLRGALDSVGTDELDVNVEASVLPTDAATQTTLALCLTALQLIDNLYGALESVGTDRLIVRGEDQLYSYQLALNSTRIAAISGAGGYIDSNNPGAGVIWKVTSVAVQNQTSPFTRVEMMIRIATADYHFHSESFAWGAGSFASVQCEKWLSGNDIIRVYLAGGLGGDTIKISLTGHIMTLET